MSNQKIWMNGKYLDKSEGVTGLSTEALHYGTCVFEGVLCVKGKNGSAVFRLQDHINRMFRSIAPLNGILSYSEKEIGDAIMNLVKANKYDSCYIRPIVFKDADYLDFEPEGKRLNVAILCKRFKFWMYQHQMGRRIKAMVSKKIRSVWAEDLVDVKISGKYLNSLIAKKDAARAGFDDALFLDGNDMVSEGTSSNIFLVKGGVIKTPLCKNSLKGITQDSIMRIGKDLGYVTLRQDMTRNDLYDADELFFTSTARGIVSISHIDSKKIINPSKKEITSVLRARYIDTIRGKDSNYQEWLTLI